MDASSQAGAEIGKPTRRMNRDALGVQRTTVETIMAVTSAATEVAREGHWIRAILLMIIELIDACLSRILGAWRRRE